MHQVHNVLYEVKKESLKRSSPMFEPNHERDDLKEQLAKLRTTLRNKDTQIIRLQGQIEELKQRITLFQYNSKVSNQQQQETIENQKSVFSQVPMIMENKELKESNEVLHKENLELNGKNNQVEAELRQTKSDLKRIETKLKELEIVDKLREERFAEEVKKLTPIIVEENQDFTFVKEGILKLSSFLRENLISIVFEIFLKCAKECQKEKKTSSFSIFKQYWLQIKRYKGQGFYSVAKVYEAVKKLTKMLIEQYGALKDEEYRDTQNEWVINTLIDIKHTNSNQIEQKLFRYLALLYRSKFPIKNKKIQFDIDVKEHFEDLICQEICHQLSHN